MKKRISVLVSVLLVVGTVGIVNAATTVTENFEGFTLGDKVETSAVWYSDDVGESGVVGQDAGDPINATQVAGSADSITTRLGTPAVTWDSLSIGDSLVISMDYQADHLVGNVDQHFNDDRLGMMAQNGDMSSSSHILAAQLEGDEIWFYEKESDQHENTMVDFSGDITAGAWYNFVVSIEKEGATSFTITGTVSEVGGTWSETGSFLVTDSDSEFFGNTDLFPAFKNYDQDGAVGACDNFSFTVVPEPMTLSLLGFGGLALLRRRKA